MFRRKKRNLDLFEKASKKSDQKQITVREKEKEIEKTFQISGFRLRVHEKMINTWSQFQFGLNLIEDEKYVYNFVFL